MSTLTKVFIVLLVIFSIAFTTMTVSMVAQQTNWRTLAERYQEQRNIADTNLRHHIAASAAELATAQEVIQSHLSKITELEAQASKHSTSLAEMEANLARAAAEKGSADAMNSALLAQLESTEKARGNFQSQRDDLERRSIDLERRNIDLNDRVNEQTARIAVLMEQKRQYEQQINMLRGGTRMSGMPSEDPASAAMPGVNAATSAVASGINGTVVDVAGNVVTISVGASDGVKKDMVFVVHRNNQYIGDLQITMVDPERAAGRPVGAAFTPQSGDQVVDAIGFGSPRG